MSYTEHGHASPCDVYMVLHGSCTCSVGEVERLRVELASMTERCVELAGHASRRQERINTLEADTKRACSSR